MTESTCGNYDTELQGLRELTERVGRNPLLTQASTGNSSAKVEDVLWIKTSGKWMADAVREDIFTSLNLCELQKECLERGVDPAERYPEASLETALHAVLPRRVVLHVHCVDTIAWAVRRTGPHHLRRLLKGLSWQWIPYTTSGLPLSRAIERVLARFPDTDLFVLGNHGLVVCGDSAKGVEELLKETRRRLALPCRKRHPGDYAALWEMSMNTQWEVPDDDDLHALGTDRISQSILRGGLLYPCQAIFTGSGGPDLFRAIPYPERGTPWQLCYGNRTFLIIEGRGVIVRRDITPGELAMLSGLAQVVQRLNTVAAVRYLREAEIAAIPYDGAYRYRERAGQRRSTGA